MSVKTKDELLQSVSEILGERNDDAALQLIEDISDSISIDAEAASLRDQLTTQEAAWQAKYDELNTSWRDRYKQRFFSGEDTVQPEEEKPQAQKSYTYDALFH